MAVYYDKRKYVMEELVKVLKQKIIRTHLFNLVTSRLHFMERRRELKKIVGNLIDKYQKEPMEQKPLDRKISNYLWVCWWQGESGMSPIVRTCYKQIKELNAGGRKI